MKKLKKFQKPLKKDVYVRVYCGYTGKEIKHGRLIDYRIFAVTHPVYDVVLYYQEKAVIEEIKGEIDVFDCYLCLDENRVVWETQKEYESVST